MKWRLSILFQMERILILCGMQKKIYLQGLRSGSSPFHIEMKSLYFKIKICLNYIYGLECDNSFKNNNSINYLKLILNMVNFSKKINNEPNLFSSYFVLSLLWPHTPTTITTTKSRRSTAPGGVDEKNGFFIFYFFIYILNNRFIIGGFLIFGDLCLVVWQ